LCPRSRVSVVHERFGQQRKKKTSSNLRYPMFSGGEKNLYFSSVLLIGTHTIATLARKLHIFAQFIICTPWPVKKFTISPQYR